MDKRYHGIWKIIFGDHHVSTHFLDQHRPGCLCCALPFPAQAQARVNISGRLVNSLSGDPIPNAVVQIDELRRTTTSGSNGTFTLSDVPPGTYHVSVHARGYSTRPMEVSVSTTELNLGDFAVDPELHFQEQTTVTGEARSNFEVYQPTAVLSGQELTKQLEMSLGATLENQPGVASRSFGPAPSRPVFAASMATACRFFRTASAWAISSQSGDHGVTINPAAATRIDVVRGPATLSTAPTRLAAS